MSIFGYPSWELSEALTCFDVQDKDSMERLKEVVKQSDANYLENVREYFAWRRIRPNIDEERIIANNLAMNPLRARLNLLLIQHHQMQPIFMTVTREQAKQLNLNEWKEVCWDVGEDLQKE